MVSSLLLVHGKAVIDRAVTRVIVTAIEFEIYIASSSRGYAEMIKMTVIVNGRPIEWQDTPPGLYITPVKEHILWQDKQTGAKVVLRKIPKGEIHEYRHRHPHANHWGLMLSGEVVFPDGTHVTCSEHSYDFSYFPQNASHGGGPPGTRYTQDTIVLIYFDGPETKVIE